MSRKSTIKQKLNTAEASENQAIENSYSDLPLFDYCVTKPLNLAKYKEDAALENIHKKIPPLPLTSQKCSGISSKPKASKATVVPPSPIPQYSMDEQLTEKKSILLTVSDLCTLLKVSRSTLIRMEKSGQLPGRLMLGGSVRYHQETIDAWLRDLAANLL